MGSLAWQQVVLEAEGLDVEALEAALLASGAEAVTLQNAGRAPVLEPARGEAPVHDVARVVALFRDRDAIDAALGAVCARLGLSGPPTHRIEPIADRGWERASAGDWGPMAFGRRLWVCPSHITPPQPDAVNLILDPGLAFGTGTHPTTAMCLEWLDDIDLTGRTVVDYGCGSGVVGIAAALLGAERVWAVDTDRQALAATRDNARRNGVEHALRTCPPEALDTGAADVLVANILEGPLRELAGRFAGLIRSGGRIALSGLLEEQGDGVAAAYEPEIRLDGRIAREGWLRLSGRRR